MAIENNSVDAGKLFVEAFSAEEEGQLETAVLLYARSASLGSSSAMINLGNLYDDILDPRDPMQAVKYYEDAVRFGNPDGASCLAAHYKNLEDHRLYQHWLKRAADMGDEDAIKLLGGSNIT